MKTSEFMQTTKLDRAGKSVKTKSGAKVEVLQGDLTVTGAAEGFTVENKNEGKVSINNVEVKQSGSYTVHNTTTGGSSQPAGNPSAQNSEKDNTPKTGAKDFIVIVVVIMIISAIAITLLNRKD